MVIVRTRSCRRCKRARLTPDEIAGNHTTCRRCGARRWKRMHGTRVPCSECGSRRKRRPRTRICDVCKTSKTDEQRVRERTARYYAKLRADPVRWAEFIDTKRMEYRMRSERAGTLRTLTDEQWVQGNVGDVGRSHNIDAAPIVRAVDEWLDHEDGLDNHAQLGAHTLKQLERLSGVPLRTIARLVHGESQRCALRTADRLATAIGTHVDVVYADAPGVRSTAEVTS